MGLYNLYSSPDIVQMIKFRRMRWEGHKTLTEGREGYRALVGKREGNRPLGTPRRRWEDNMKMGLKEV